MQIDNTNDIDVVTNMYNLKKNWQKIFGNI